MRRAEPRPPPDASRATRLLLLSLLIVASIPSAAQSRRQENLDVTPATATLTVGQTLQLTVSNAAGSVTWSSNDPTVATVSASGQVTARSVGDGAARIQAKYKSQRGWCDVTVTAGAPANQAPTAAISSPSADVTIEEGASVSFAGSGTDPDGSVVGYTWAFPGGAPESSGVAVPGSVTYPTPGVFTASLTVRDEDGATSPAATREITVTAAPVIIPPPTETEPAPPTSVALVGSGSGSMVDNPTAVRFVPSSDHSTLEGYDRRTVHVASGSITEVTDVGVPTPSGGFCTVPISTAGWTADAAYRIEVRSSRSSLTSAWVPSAQTGRRTTPPVESGDYYVATTGSDSNAGTSGSPFRTFSKAISVVTAGQSIIVRGGSYAAFSWPSGGPNGTAWDNAVTVEAYPGETVWITGSINFSGSSTRQYIIFDGINVDATTSTIASGVTLDGPQHHIRFQNAEHKNSPNQGIYQGPGSHHCEFINLNVHDNGSVNNLDHGFYLEGDNNLLQNCRAHHNKAQGIQLYSGSGSPDNNVIDSCRFDHNGLTGTNGAGLTVGGANNLLINTISDGNKTHGIDFGWSGSKSNNKALNCTVYGNGEWGVQVVNSTGTQLKNTIIRNNGNGATSFGSSTVTQVTNLTGSDPLFVNAGTGDFHLQAASPAVNAGTTLAEVTHDKDGVTRPQGAAYDIGAYER